MELRLLQEREEEIIKYHRELRYQGMRSTRMSVVMRGPSEFYPLGVDRLKAFISKYDGHIEIQESLSTKRDSQSIPKDFHLVDVEFHRALKRPFFTITIHCSKGPGNIIVEFIRSIIMKARILSICYDTLKMWDSDGNRTY